MAARAPLTVTENNDETVELTIDREDPSDDLTSVVILEFYLKVDSCDTDTSSSTLLLSTTDPAELLIIAQSASQITAEAYIPASALGGAFTRQYHVDALNAGGQRRTALFGPVTVNNV